MTIMFDFGGVMVDLDQQRCMDSFVRLGVKDIGQYIDKYRQNGLFQQLELGNVSNADFHDAIRTLCGQDVADEAIDAAWCDFLVDVPQYRLDFIKELRERGLRVILLSNSNEIHFGKWIVPFFEKNGGLSCYFDAVYFSHQLHLAKPDEDIFRAVLREEQEMANNILFLDDGFNNIQTAKRLGFQTYLVREREDWREVVKKYLNGNS